MPCATATFSSRKIARRLHEDVAIRVLEAENFPAHRTSATCRALHLAEFTELFVQVVRLTREMGCATTRRGDRVNDMVKDKIKNLLSRQTTIA